MRATTQLTKVNGILHATPSKRKASGKKHLKLLTMPNEVRDIDCQLGKVIVSATATLIYMRSKQILSYSRTVAYKNSPLSSICEVRILAANAQ